MRSIIKLEKIKRAEACWDIYVASQGGQKDLKRYTDSLMPPVEKGAEELIKDFSKRR